MTWSSCPSIRGLGVARAGWEGEGENGTSTGMACRADFAVMSGDDLVDDRQTQPRTAAVPRAADLVELLEDVGQMLRWDSLAGIRHGQPNGSIGGAGRHLDLTPGAGIAQGIADQVVEDVPDPLAVRQDFGQVLGHVRLQG